MKRNRLSPFFRWGSVCAAFGSMAMASDKWLGDRGNNWEEHIVSTKPRAQVLAELNDAPAKGVLSNNGNASSYPSDQTSFEGAEITRKTRAHVIAELNDAQARGLWPNNGDASSYPDVGGVASMR